MLSKKKEVVTGEEAENKTPETDERTEAEEAEAGGKKGKKKLVIIVGVLLVIVVVAMALLMGGKPKLDAHGNPILEEKELSPEEKAAKDAAALAAAKPVYYELPEFLVNLNSTTSRVSFLKMSVTLELNNIASVAVMDANKPRIQDIFNTYLRELRPSDIQGSSGIYRLRTELLSRLNSTIENGAVKDILFSEIIVQ